MISKRKIIWSLWLFALLVNACATAPPKPDPKMADGYIMQARQMEEQGELNDALEQYKLALTVDPQNKTADENRIRLLEKLKQLADERYQLGMKYYLAGKYSLARKEFLTTLKYDPDHEEASKMLVSRQQQKSPQFTYHTVQPGESLSLIAKQYYGDYKKYDLIARFNNLQDITQIKPGQRIMIPESDLVQPPAETVQADAQQTETAYVMHEIRPGETISKLAQAYYGDYKLFHAIAQFNDMEDATRVSTGQKIRIPRLAGRPFTMPTDQNAGMQATEKKPAAMEISETVPPEPQLIGEPSLAAEPAADEQILAYRQAGIEAFKSGKYEDAVFELHKALEASPNDNETRLYLGRAYYGSGKTLFENKEFDAAREAFESAVQYDPSCRDCRSYVEKSRLGPLEVYRGKGIEAFKKNDFNTAILQLGDYLKAQPNDPEIRGYLSKAFYQKGLIAYNKGDYLSAKKDFESGLEYDSGCQQCASYIEKSTGSYKEAHYNKGIVYFGNEQLTESIREWELVYELDPGYKDVEQNLKKARALLEKLEKIKKSQQ